MRPLAIAKRLRKDTATLHFAEPVVCVYRPLEYAWNGHRAYLERYARPRVELLFVGMNPGPFGMVQTGVPFGEVASVRDFLGIETEIARPLIEHKQRPIRGFACPRSEVSGRRVWGWVAERFGTADAFFDRCFIWNWCPLAFVSASGSNLTPNTLPVAERRPLEQACDRALRSLVDDLQPALLVGFGAFASERARKALGQQGPRVGTVLHPSPASPAANRGWAPAVEASLRELGFAVPSRRGRVAVKSGQ